MATLNLSWIAFQVSALAETIKADDDEDLVGVLCTAIADYVNVDKGFVYALAVDVVKGRSEVHQAAGDIVGNAYSEDETQRPRGHQPALFSPTTSGDTEKATRR